LRVLIISDIHGNEVALKAVLEDAENYDAIWVLGDLVDYGPDPHLVVDEVRFLKPELIVMGNHDNAVANNVDCRCLVKTHELSVYTRKFISLKLLSDDQIAWLRRLPIINEFKLDGIKFLAVHASPNNPLHGYLLPDLGRDEFLNYLTFIGASEPVRYDYVVAGHTHIPMDRKIDDVRVVNPGSVGQPRDGDNRASYALLNTDSKSFIVKRVKYDIQEVIRRIDSLGIERRFRDWLVRILITGEV